MSLEIHSHYYGSMPPKNVKASGIRENQNIPGRSPDAESGVGVTLMICVIVTI